MRKAWYLLKRFSHFIGTTLNDSGHISTLLPAPEEKLSRRAKTMLQLAKHSDDDLATWQRPLRGWPAWLEQFGLEAACDRLQASLPEGEVVLVVDSNLSMKEPVYKAFVLQLR